MLTSKFKDPKLFNLFSDLSYETWSLLKAALIAGFTVLLTASVAKIWQQRNWLLQQEISDQEKISTETKKLFDDFVALSSKRHFRTKRLYWALKAKDEKRIDEALVAYREVLYEWNDAEISWKVRFVKNLDFGSHISANIDDRIRVPFVATGSILERGVKRSKSAKSVEFLLNKMETSIVETNLTSSSRAIFEIGREIYGKLDYLSSGRLDEHQIIQNKLTKGNYNDLSLLQLFKALITSNRSGQFW